MNLVSVAKGRATKVALTVDADDATFENIIDALKPDILQIHGKETTARVRDIRQKFGLPVMKALPVETAADLAPLPGYAAVADRILFDARAPKGATRPGGLGAAFDWHVLENLDLKLPFMVSGGLNAGNVAEAVRVTRAGGVDVSSGVERTPGVKDPEMIREFIRAARATHLTSPLPVYGERSDRLGDPGEGRRRCHNSHRMRRESPSPQPSPRKGGAREQTRHGNVARRIDGSIISACQIPSAAGPTSTGTSAISAAALSRKR